MEPKAKPEFDFVAAATRNEEKRKMKIPGEVPPVGKMSIEIARLREEIKTKTVSQLKEVLDRQEKILKNPALVKRLPDKGEKARKTKEMIVGLIIDKEKVEDLEDEMKKMKINTEKMEWKGGLLDSDDDSDPEDDAPSKNPLSVLAQGIIPKVSSTAKSEIVSKNELSDLELFAQKEIEKVDNLAPKESFVPFNNLKTTKVDEDLRKQIGTAPTSNKVSPPKSKIKFVPKHKTPSIPLPNVYVCETKQLSLAESLKLQQEQDKKLREIQMKHAAEKLMASSNVGGVSEEVETIGSQFQEYRSKTEEDEEEVEDVDDDEGVGVVGVTQLEQD